MQSITFSYFIHVNYIRIRLQDKNYWNGSIFYENVRSTHLLIEKAKLLKCKYAYVTTVNDYAAKIFEKEN